LIFPPSLRVNVGAKAFFEIEGGAFSGVYPTRIEDINETEGLISIAYPVYKGALVPLRGDKYYIWVTTQRGIYKYPIEIVGVKEENISLLVLRIVGRGEHIQRRRFVRVEVNLPFTYRLKGKITSPKKGFAKDLSAGGLRGVFEEPLLIGQKVLIRLDLEDGCGPMVLEGRIVRIDVGDDEIEHGVEFLNLGEKIIRRIVRFAFKREMELREKGLI